MHEPQRRFLVLQHSRDSPLGVIGDVLAERDITARVVDCYKGLDVEPEHAEHDGLILLGGPQRAADDTLHPHFPAVLDLIREYHKAEKPILGICLGAQLAARALGGQAITGDRGEFGFTALERVATDGDDLLAGIELPLHVMQWHEDSFHSPPGAQSLLRSDACADQAFRVGAATCAFQGHIEVNRDIVRAWGRDQIQAG